MDANAIAANERFASLVASLPTRTIVIGTHANGMPIETKVHSLFGDSK